MIGSTIGKGIKARSISTLEVLASLRLTIVLLVLSIVMIFAATLDQVHIGIWGVQERYFHSFLVWMVIPHTNITMPVFPGGYLIGPLLLANLISAHIYRFKLSWKKAGIWLVHVGLILLLIGEGLSGLMQRDGQIKLDVGQSKSFVESTRDFELAIVDVTDPKTDTVYAITSERLGSLSEIADPRMPLKVQGLDYFPNAGLRIRDAVMDGAPMAGIVGVGATTVVAPFERNAKEGEMNWPAAYVRLSGKEGSIGVWLVSAMMNAPQTVVYAGRTLELSLRLRRDYLPFSLGLVRFTHETYPGSTIPKNFASLVRLHGKGADGDRSVQISMNNPLRYGGFAFYQAGYENNDRTSVIQAVRNPSWTLPYLSCAMIALGLVVQFGLSLWRFVSGRRRLASAQADTPVTAEEIQLLHT